ncbi:MAG: DUF1640 domain-containing protein [Deltaproteobacteria bacterium]|nr:DUF1640 domain-containing protein [Deltaproteobacteria bacterium]
MLTLQQTESLKSAFGLQSVPLIEVLESLGAQVAAQLSSELATKADIAEIKGSINTLREMSKRDSEEVRGELKADIAALEGKLRNDITALRGELKKDVTELRGELKSISLLMKTLIGLVIFGVSFFSPVGLKLLEYALKGIK